MTTIAGDVADPGHRARLVAAINQIGALDLLVNNASTLGPTPLRPLADLSPADLADVLAVNVIAPFALTAALLPALSAAARGVLDISSDAAVEHYPGWGGYGASKAALDHLTLTFGVENLDIACYAVDPGDMRTAMQQAAFPGEDISDRTAPVGGGPRAARPDQRRPPSGRYRAADLAAPRPGVVDRRCLHDDAARRPVDRSSARPTTGPRPNPPSTAAWPGTRSGCWSRPRHGITHTSFRDLPDAPRAAATCWW